FFVFFFAWFAVAPLMPTIRADLGLTPAQIANINIAAVCVTILVRLLIGPLCDRYGPRLTYTALLALGAIPVIAISFAHSYESFLFWRLCIGAIGPLCDRYGPRLTYTALLALGAIPVIAISFAHSYESFLFWRLCIGAIG